MHLQCINIGINIFEFVILAKLPLAITSFLMHGFNMMTMYVIFWLIFQHMMEWMHLMNLM